MSNLVARLRLYMPSDVDEGMMDDAADRIEALEAALQHIAGGENSFFGMMQIARAALDKDAGK